MSEKEPPGGIGVDQHYTAEAVQAEMNVIAQNYLKMLGLTLALYYGLRSVGYFLKFPPEIVPYLAAISIPSALIGIGVFLYCRIRQLPQVKIELTTFFLGCLVILNVFGNMYLTGNKNQFFSAGLAIIVFGISTTQLRVWFALVLLCVATFIVAAANMPVLGVEVISLLIGCLLISIAAFFTRAPAIRKRVELQLQLEDKADSLEGALKAKDRFLANMSHELRTPMTGVLGMMDLLRSTELNSEQDQLLKTAKTSAGYLLAIINDILDYSKLESGKFELNVGPMDALAMTRDVAGMLRSQAEAKGISVTVHTPAAGDLWVLGDSVRLGQILFNLLGNAIKFTEKGGADIYLDAEEEGDAVRLTWRVCDSGAGIPKDRIDTLFERFEQLGDDTTRAQTGTGLGLAIIKELVALMEGDISVESTVGEGSEFRVAVTLPKSQKVLREASVQAASESMAAVGHLKVLVAEDNLVNQVLIRKLMTAKGWEVMVVANGEAAVEAALAEKPGFDLVLMDVRMPVMDGPTATKVIKEKMKSPPPIIALTANTLTPDVESYLAAGMDAHVGKPIVIEELMETIQSLLKSGR
ncbi:MULTISPECIES: ATP-binding protein [Kordiimonas]|uniref:ATP-binding protein n=1 Tax=Kordiimonas TaxID=288021 RepID=UPI00257E2473|nr:ATP-binding protein [Kordiimonas sp. UBA4487]